MYNKGQIYSILLKRSILLRHYTKKYQLSQTSYRFALFILTMRFWLQESLD